MQDSQLSHLSVVVTANDHNPTLLNPDFLARTNIVPDEWGWSLSGTPITTPPYSYVSYDSGVSVIVEPNKLTVSDAEVQEPSQSKAIEIAKNYIKTLPYVLYTAVGVNFHSVIPIQDAREFIKTRFLSKDILGDESLITIGMKFVYDIDEDAKFVLEINPAYRPIDQDDEGNVDSVMLTQGNFHKSCSGNDCSQNLLSDFPNITKYWERYQSAVEKLIRG